MKNKITIVSSKKDIPKIKSIIKGLALNNSVNFITPENIKKITNKFSPNLENFVIFNYDNPELQDLCKPLNFKKITFGFSKEADFSASDQNLTDQGINFKLNYKGSSVPVWFKRDQVHNVLAAISAAVISGMNVIEVSEKLKSI